MSFEHHEKCRQSICLICQDRAKNVIKNDSKLHKLVNEFIVENFSPEEDYRLPRALCDTCRIKLTKFGTGNFCESLPEVSSYKEMVNYRPLRSHDICSCQICTSFKNSTRFGYRKSLSKRIVSQNIKLLENFHF